MKDQKTSANAKGVGEATSEAPLPPVTGSASPSREQKLYDALKRITQYSQPERIRKTAERDYGLSGEEAIEMAYENVLAEASAAIRGMRRPK